MECLVIIPPESPGNHVRIAPVGNRVPQMQNPGLGHDHGQKTESKENKNLAGCKTSVKPGNGV
jgi:hypothetical protein